MNKGKGKGKGIANPDSGPDSDDGDDDDKDADDPGEGLEAVDRGVEMDEFLGDLVAPQEGDRVLDVACGTGPVARNIAPSVGLTGRVVGLDLNSGMLDTARAMPVSAEIPIE